MSHGGKRQGAGRKAVKNKAQSRVMRIPEQIAPAIKRIVDVLKDHPDLQDDALKLIYTLKYPESSVSHMIKEELCAAAVSDLPGLGEEDYIEFDSDPDCDNCKYYTSCYELYDFPFSCSQFTCYFKPASS